MSSDLRTAQIIGSLRHLVPADAVEADHLGALLALLKTTARPFARDQYEPGHITASAFVLDSRRARLLLIHHGKLGRWLQPGGHVEPNDADIEAAARREVREETGLAELHREGEIFDVDVHAIPARPGTPAHRHFDVRLLFTSAAVRLRAASDACAARWVPLGEVSALESDASVMRAVRKLRNGGRG